MQTDKDIPGISCGLVNDNNIFEWEAMLMINDDVKWYGGMCHPPPSTRGGEEVLPTLLLSSHPFFALLLLPLLLLLPPSHPTTSRATDQTH